MSQTVNQIKYGQIKDKGSKFLNRSMKFYLEDNIIEMYSAHNEGKSVVTERFIRTLKKNFC